jgi:hypothetical protein
MVRFDSEAEESSLLNACANAADTLELAGPMVVATLGNAVTF